MIEWVEILKEAKELKKLPIPILLSWYLMILHYEDTAAVAAATT